ncbi:uncharacterized protein METZ01_LOCUS282703, partial [marine metagenome]
MAEFLREVGLQSRERKHNQQDQQPILRANTRLLHLGFKIHIGIPVDELRAFRQILID